jgi:hypothetical protein
MSKERASLGFGDELADFKPDEWAPKPATNANKRPDPAETRKAAEAAGFRSREPKTAAAPVPAPVTPAPGSRAGEGTLQQRRRRTGRNAQFNLKARPETIEAFCAIADRQGWGLGETLEYAVDLLQEKYPAKARTSAEK